MVAACDSMYERAARVAAEYRIDRATDRVDDLINAKDIHLLIVATPTFGHFDIARRAIQAGKHVLVMKPLTASVEQAEELVDLAERAGVMLAVDHTFVYTGAVQKIRDLIAAGELGELYYLDSVRINLGLFQPDVNVVWDLAPHDISIIDYVLDGRQPTEVSAIGAAHAGSPHENIAYVTMRYGEHLLAHVHVNWLAPAKVRRTIIGGSKRMVIYDDTEPTEKIKIYDAGVTITPTIQNDEKHSQVVVYRAGDMHAPKVSEREALTVEAEHLVQCIRTGERPRADGQAGLRVVKILAAAQESIRTQGRPVVMDASSSAARANSR